MEEAVFELHQRTMQGDVLAMAGSAPRGWSGMYRRGDADGVGTAGADGATCDRVQLLVDAELDGGEEVTAAAKGKACRRGIWVALGEQREDRFRGKRNLVIEAGELSGDADEVHSLAGTLKETIRIEAGAGSVCLPFVLQQAGVGVQVAELRRVTWAGGIRTVLGVAAVEALGPQPMEGKGAVLGALGCVGALETELRRP